MNGFFNFAATGRSCSPPFRRRETEETFFNLQSGPSMQSMRDQIVARIWRLGEEKAFSAKDFLDIASRTTIDVSLASLTSSGKIRRVRRGLYDMPKVNPRWAAS
jgi:hypothetical protein